MDSYNKHMISLFIIRQRNIQRLLGFNEVHQQAFGIWQSARIPLDDLAPLNYFFDHLGDDVSFMGSLPSMKPQIISLCLYCCTNLVQIKGFAGHETLIYQELYAYVNDPNKCSCWDRFELSWFHISTRYIARKNSFD